MDTPITGLCYDSRQVKAGDLFIAVSGLRQNGHAFVDEAVRKGARAVLIESGAVNGLREPYVRVADSRKAMARLAVNFYENPSASMAVVGITGTNGKTTSSFLVESVLKHAGYAVGVIGTLGYRWRGNERKAPMTTPESLDLQRLFYQMHRDGISHVVMEVSSHALALGRVDGCRFRTAVFTNLSQDHLDFHGTMEDYFEAKSLLFRRYIDENVENTCTVINLDDPFGKRLIKKIKKSPWTYSVENKGARVWVKRADLSTSGIKAEISTPKGPVQLQSPLLGRLNLYNILSAVTVTVALDVPNEAISKGIEAVSQVDGRLERIPLPAGMGFEVLVDYAHTPDAMEKSLSCLKEMAKARLWVVFGCGGDRDRGKRPLMGQVAGEYGDLIVLTSDNPRSESPERIIQDIEPGVISKKKPRLDRARLLSAEKGYVVEVDRREAIELALAHAEPGDIVFVGGKGHETYQIIGDEIRHFDDREVIKGFVERLL